MRKMKAGQYTAPKTVKVNNVNKPEIEQNEALIKVSHAGICGTDMMIYFGKHPRAKAPLTMGHEFSGTIESVEGSTTFHPGDRVVVEPTISCGKCPPCQSGESHVCEALQLIGIDMDGGFSEYVRVPVDRLHKVPEQLSLANAALAEPVAVAVHTVRRSTLKIGENVAVLGAGPIGLLIGIIAKLNGAKNIFISDISPFRLKAAKALGFHPIDATDRDVVENIKKLNNNQLLDVVFEVAGNQATANQMIDLIKTQGQIVVVSVYKNNPELPLAKMHYRELSLTTTRCYSSEDYSTAIDIMASGKIDFSELITHELDIENIAEGFALMQNPDASLKVLIKQS